nr:hypothetical protein [Streptomyces yatensis]
MSTAPSASRKGNAERTSLQLLKIRAAHVLRGRVGRHHAEVAVDDEQWSRRVDVQRFEHRGLDGGRRAVRRGQEDLPCHRAVVPRQRLDVQPFADGSGGHITRIDRSGRGIPQVDPAGVVPIMATGGRGGITATGGRGGIITAGGRGGIIAACGRGGAEQVGHRPPDRLVSRAAEQLFCPVAPLHHRATAVDDHQRGITGHGNHLHLPACWVARGFAVPAGPRRAVAPQPVG